MQVTAVESVGSGTEESENEEDVKENWNSDEGNPPAQSQFWNYGQENYGKYGMIRNRSSSMDNEEILWDMKASELKLHSTLQVREFLTHMKNIFSVVPFN